MNFSTSTIPADVCEQVAFLGSTLLTSLPSFCLVRGRTNIELREQLTDSEGKKSLFNEDGTISTVGPITKVRAIWLLFVNSV